MNAEVLIRYFDRISDAPDALPSLRQFILDLAIRGKLVEQDHNDEPASALLKRIELEKARLVKSGEIRDQVTPEPVTADDVEFQLASGWSWVRLATISRRIQYGFTASADKSLNDVRLLRITDIQNNSVDWSTVPGCEISSEEVTQYRLAKSDILIARTGGTIGKTFLVTDIPPKAVFASYLIRVQTSDELLDRYIKIFLESPLYWKQLHEGTRGTGQPNVNGQTLGRLIVALPPLAEQHRIVTKVEELMALCDRLGQAQKEREARRDRLTAASLHQLNNGAEGDELQERARFFISQLSKITARPDQIRLLRETILDLAVRGCLAQQDADDELVADSLKRIQMERGDLVKQGRLRPDKPTSPIDQRDTPFSLPPSWSWVRIAQAALFTEYGTSHQSAHTESGVPVLKMGDIQDGSVILGGQKKVPDSIDDLPGLYLQKYDLLYNRTNSAELVGKTGIYLGEDHEYTFASYLIRIRFSTNSSDPRFFNLAMNAPYFRATQIVPHLKQQCGQANVNGTTLKGMMVPFPPIAEQRRIVAKVEQLMTVCDQLEGQLTSVQTQGNLLLEATLHDTLYPEHDTALEAPGGFRSRGQEIGAFQ